MHFIVTLEAVILRSVYSYSRLFVVRMLTGKRKSFNLYTVQIMRCETNFSNLVSAIDLICLFIFKPVF